jgi:hypothetical protein
VNPVTVVVAAAPGAIISRSGIAKVPNKGPSLAGRHGRLSAAAAWFE